MRQLLFSILVLNLLVSSLLAQTTTTADKLTIDRIYNSGDFSAQRFGPHKWLADGSFFTTIDYNRRGETELILNDSKTGEQKTLIEAAVLRDPMTKLPITIEDYFWSPDEKWLLIFTNTEKVWRTNTRGDFYLLDLGSKKIRQLGLGFEKSSLMFAKFSPDGDQIAYVSRQNIFVEDAVSGTIQQLTYDGTEDIINGTFDWAYEEEFFCKDGFRWSPDGKSISFWQIDATEIRDFYLINNTDEIYSEIIPIQYPKVGQTPSSARIGVIDLDSKVTKWLAIPGDPSQNYLPRMQWLAPENSILITQLSRKQNHLHLWLYDRDQETLHNIYEETSETWIDIIHIDISISWEMHDQPILDNGKAFVWMSEIDGWRHLYKVNTVSGVTSLLTPGDYDIASIKGYDEKANKLYVIASPENPTHRYLYSLDLDYNNSLEQITPSATPGIHEYDISPSGRYALHKYEFSNTPETGAIISLPQHQITQSVLENTALKATLNQIKLPEVEFFTLTTEDGITLDGKMIKPVNFTPEKKYPVIFYVYGEPAKQTAVANLDNLWHLMLAQDGYLIITLDNRGTPSLKGSAWRKSIYRKMGIINVRDQAMAAKKILEWDFVDPERVGVWGWSGGGAMTLNLLFKYPDIYQVGIAVSAVTNQLLYDNIYQERYMGLPSENLADFVACSPASHAAGLEGKLLYIHGTGDDNVHYQNAEFLINALIAENKIFDLMIYPNRSHSIYEGRNTTRHLYQTMTNYFKKHLPIKN